MKKYFLKYSVVTLFVFLCGAGYAQTEAVNSRALIENANSYDNKEVVYQGEVIGDVMVRGNFAWVNINDGGQAIGVWMPAVFASQIEHKGSYRAKGDWLEVEGTFHRACPEHGGDMDIHARIVGRLRPGEEINQPIDKAKRNAAILLIGLLCLVLILRVFKRK